jgi:hypothetical protein
VEIKLQVDGAQVSDEVRELLDNLTPEQKRDMALQLLKDTMTDTKTRFNKRVGVQQALAEMSNESVEYRWQKVESGFSGGAHHMRLESRQLKSDSQYERNWRSASGSAENRFDKLTKWYSEPLTYFRETILGEMLKVAVEHVEETVKGSDKVQDAIAKAVADIENRIPDMVQNAMRQMFVNTLSQAMQDQTQAFQATEQQANLLGEIKERLDRAGLY